MKQDIQDIKDYAYKCSKIYSANRVKYHSGVEDIELLIRRHSFVSGQKVITKASLKSAITSFYARGNYIHPNLLSDRAIKYSLFENSSVKGLESIPTSISSLIDYIKERMGIIDRDEYDMGVDFKRNPNKKRLISLIWRAVSLNLFLAAFFGKMGLAASLETLFSGFATNMDRWFLKRDADYDDFFVGYHQIMASNKVPDEFKGGEFMTAWKEIIDIFHEKERKERANPDEVIKFSNAESKVIQYNFRYMTREIKYFDSNQPVVKRLSKKFEKIRDRLQGGGRRLPKSYVSSTPIKSSAIVPYGNITALVDLTKKDYGSARSQFLKGITKKLLKFIKMILERIRFLRSIEIRLTPVGESIAVGALGGLATVAVISGAILFDESRKKKYQEFFDIYEDIMRDPDIPDEFKKGDFIKAWKEAIDTLNDYEDRWIKWKDKPRGKEPMLSKSEKASITENLLYMKSEIDYLKRSIKPLSGLGNKLDLILKRTKSMNLNF